MKKLNKEERLRKAAKAVKKDEAKSLAKIIKITGRIPMDRVAGYHHRNIMLEEMLK